MAISASLVSILKDTSGQVSHRIIAQALDSTGQPVPNAPLTWSTLVSTDSVTADSFFGPDGSAHLLWISRDTLVPLHLLEIRSGRTAVIRITAGEGRSVPAGSQGPTSGIAVDSVLALLPAGVSVRVLDPQGQPVPHQILILNVTTGGGSLERQTLVTDLAGRAETGWRFGSSAGTQSVEAAIEVKHPGTGRYSIVDLLSGTRSSAGKSLTITGIALPGTARQLFLAADTVLVDAVGAPVFVTALATDSHGNAIAQPHLLFQSADVGVARVQPDGSVRTTGPGMTRIRVIAGAARDSLQVQVHQRPVAIAASASSRALNHLGARTAVQAIVFDRLGVRVLGAAPMLRSLTPGLAAVGGSDTVVALQQGTALVEASLPGIADTLPIQIVQIPASIALPWQVDTMALDQGLALQAQVYDSGGSLIPNAVVALSPDDPAVIGILAPDTVVAQFPGEATVTVRSGTVSASYQVTVEGVALLADGVRTTGAAAVAAAHTLELNNGRVRLRWGPADGMGDVYIMDTRIGRSWYPATVRGAGDWLYVASGAVTAPTSISVVEDTPGRIGLAMRFGDHRFDPVRAGYPPSYQNEPFPFTRTLWLSPSDYGYFSWTELEQTMVWQGIEFEVGFGGLFGPATISTGQVQFRTDTLTKHDRFNVASVPDAAEFDLDGDPLLRVLIPLPEAPMLSPVFPGWGYGSVWVHRHDYQSYGAYLYAAPRSAASTARQLCQQAWTTAPFPLRTLSAAELSSCGR